MICSVGCGDTKSSTTQQPADAPARSTTQAATRTARPSVAATKLRAELLLDDWTDALVAASLAAQARDKAARAGKRAAYAKAAAELRPTLLTIRKFAAQGRAVMSRYRTGSARRLVIAAGDAWHAWAVAILRPGDVTQSEAREIADLGADAVAAHGRAYRAAGVRPPPAFQRGPGPTVTATR